MNEVFHRLALASVCVVLSMGGPLRAQAPVLVLDLRAPHGLDAAELREGLESDLGRPVELRAPIEGEAHLRIEGGAQWTLRYSDGERVRIRELACDVEREGVHALVLVASNLVRDEASELLASLRVAPVPSERAAPLSPEPPRDAEPSALSAPQSTEEPGGRTDDGTGSRRRDPPVVQAEEARPASRAWTPAHIGVDVVPYLGSSMRHRGAEQRELSLGLLGAYTGRLSGVGISGLVDITRETAGLQIGGALNLTLRSVSGVQLSAGVNVVQGELEGIQGSAGANWAGTLEGVQLAAGMNGTRGDAEGLQLAVVDWVGGELEGVQLGVLTLARGEVQGVQASIATFAGGLRGVQASLLNIASGPAHGAQLGLVNYAGSARGLQLGLINVAAGEVDGAQVGLINIADDADAGIGLINIYRRGRTDLRVGYDTGGFVLASVVHGSRHTHTIYSAGANALESPTAYALGVGLGVRLHLGHRARLDVDLMYHSVFSDAESLHESTLLEPRVVFNVPFFRSLGAYLSAGYRVRIDPLPGVSRGPFTTVHNDGTSGLRLEGAFTISAGVQIFWREFDREEEN